MLHRQSRVSLVVATLLAVGASVPCVIAQQIDLRVIDDIVRAQADSGFSGVVLVASGDSVLIRRAYGHVSSAGEHFWIASITKSFTAAAILALQTEGGLSVHDSIGRFLSGVPADKRAITIHELLTHTAGFHGATTGNGISDRDRAVRAILSRPLAYVPGGGYEYGNDDYALLAAIVEIVSRKTWADFVRERIVVPASLTHTGFGCGPAPTAALSSRDAKFFRCANASHVADWGHRGSNGMYSTADDMLRWSRVLASGRVGALTVGDVEKPQVLVRKSGSTEVWYGYGARVNTLDGVVTEIDYSGSGDDGHTSMIRRLAAGESIVVLSNGGFHGNGTWAGYLATLIQLDR